MSKLGAHIVQGSRNGYGPYCTSKPAVVLSVEDGGALTEAKTNSGNHTYTIFRHYLYRDAPPGIDQTTPAGARAMADQWYPQLKAKWQLNPADFYTSINEPGGHDLRVIPNYVAFELRMIELAKADGYKLCVLNLAWGTPDDGNASGGQPNGGMEVWKTYYVPVIRSAFAEGMIYGRHGYGQPSDQSSWRPFKEAEYLRSIGLNGGIVITEMGINAGDFFPGVDEFMRTMSTMDARMMQHSNIIGGCAWTLGDWQGAPNWQDAIPQMSAYNVAHPTTKWTPAPIPPSLPKIVILKKPAKAEITKAENDAANDYAWNDYGRTLTHSTDDMLRMIQGGNNESYVVLAYPAKPSQITAKAALQAGGYRWIEWPEPVPTNPLIGLRLSHILPYRYVLTSPFDAPRDYPPNYKHEGADYDVVGGQPDNKVNVLCAYPGTVDRSLDSTGSYGKYVRVAHTRNGSPFYTRYAHLDARFVAVGDVVKVGDALGEIGATGKVTGEHVHLNLEVPTYGLRGYVVDWVVDPEPYMATGRDILPPVPVATIDLLPYIKGDGRLYEVRSATGNQERFQTQSSGNIFWQTKNGQYEELAYDETYIWRGLDTSPGPAPNYAERPGVPRYYTAKEPGQQRARWCRRFMAIGETFTGSGHYVQFYYKPDCFPSGANSGNATNRTTFKAKHASKTWNGITVQDIVELTNGVETWFFARGFGLVAWSSSWGSSAISEIHAPGSRPDNVRETGCFS